MCSILRNGLDVVCIHTSVTFSLSNQDTWKETSLNVMYRSICGKI
jgi:hypothetical protein